MMERAPSRFPEHKAAVDAAKAMPLHKRIEALQVALAGLPEGWSQYQWIADKKHTFGDKRVRTVSGDNGNGTGLQAIATVPGDNVFGTLAEFIAAANPDTIRMLLDRIDELTPTACRQCGCTDDHACDEGCYWVEEDLCSACADPQDGDEVEVLEIISNEPGGVPVVTFRIPTTVSRDEDDHAADAVEGRS